MNATSSRPPYPSDVTDKQWDSISVVIPPEEDRGRHRNTQMREVIDGINYRWRTGCVWRMLPHDFPPWATIYTYFRRWQHDGTLKEIRDVLLRPSPRSSRNGWKNETAPIERTAPVGPDEEDSRTPAVK